MKTFEHFPSNAECPICQTNKDKECLLVPIDGTSKDKICEAQPMHVSCLEVDMFRFNKKLGIIYLQVSK